MVKYSNFDNLHEINEYFHCQSGRKIISIETQTVGWNIRYRVWYRES